MQKSEDTVMCEYYTREHGELKREYGEVKRSELSNVKGLDLPVHTKLKKLLDK